MQLTKHIKSDKFKWAMTVVSFIVVALTLLSLSLSVSNMTTTSKLSMTNYSIGSIDTTTGKIVDSKQNIYSDLATVEEMSVKIDDNAQVTYKLAFYDENKDFVSATASQSADFDTTNIPSTAKYFRVLITPNQVDGQNVTVTLLNISKYTNMLDVSFAK